MKTILIALLTTFTLSLINAEILTVDNRAGSVAQYSDFASAYEAANSGDTILLTGSPTSYGAHNIYKPLVIIGPGYNFSEQQELTSNPSEANITLHFRVHSEYGDSSGSILKGVYTSERLVVAASNILIENCEFIYASGNYEGLYVTGQNCIVRNSFIRDVYFVSSATDGRIVNSIINFQL